VGRRRTCSCGVCPKCKDRIRKKRQYDAKTPEQRRAWKKQKDPLARYISDRRARRRHEARNPEKTAARRSVARALRSGKLQRGPCEVCGVSHGSTRTDGTTVSVEGHHTDYTKPLEVRWLCQEHHRPPWTTDRG
jgi:hypothetical protein